MSDAYSIATAPLIPWPFLAALGAVALLLLAISAWRRAPGLPWRALALALLLAALANPSLIEEERAGLPDIAVVVVDKSPSQEIGERAAQTAAARAHLEAALEELPDTETRVIEGGGAPGDDGTRLFGALGEALSQIPRAQVGAIFLLSDGQVHDVPETLDGLGIDAPLHLLLSGQTDEGDRRLTVVEAPSFGIVGRELNLKIEVEDLPGESREDLAQVILKRDGVEQQRLFVPVGSEQLLTFMLEHRGANVLEIEVEPGPRELSLNNNRAAVVVGGVRDRLRVLLVSGEPHAGERAWRNILKSDPSVDLVHFTILRPPEKQDGTPIRELSLIAFPTRELFEIKLDEFDLIIFDRYRRRGVLPSVYLENIARYVEKGGAFLEASGPTFATPLSLYRTPLGRVLPAEPTGNIIEEGFLPRLTDLGHRHPVTAALEPEREDDDQGAPWGRWFRLIEADPRSGGQVLMDGAGGLPLLVLDRVGEGRVAHILSDQMWLWSRGFEGGGPQSELLRRIAHWLMKEPDLEEEALTAEVADGRLVVRRRTLGTEPPSVDVVTPSGERRELPLTVEAPGRARGEMAAEEAGLYHVTEGDLSALAASGALNAREFADLRATGDLLEPLIDASGGAILPLAEESEPALRKVRPERDRAGNGWLGVQENGAYQVTGARRLPLLPPLLVMLLGLGALALAWRREGR
ncbi:MAG: hypothetical protein ACREDZ_00360 [Kiloniellales bacterium]